MFLFKRMIDLITIRYTDTGVPLYITKRSEAVLQWGKRKNIKKMMINGELVIEWKKEKSIKDVVVENICYD